jgi:hypothetical protein
VDNYGTIEIGIHESLLAKIYNVLFLFFGPGNGLTEEMAGP